MSSSFEKSVKGGTKVKLAAPKSKYVEHILLATQSGEAGVAEVFRSLTPRLRDATWTVAFKSLIITHLMIQDGVQDVTLRYIAIAPRNRLAMNSFTDVQTQGHNIKSYSEYLLVRAQAFEKTKCDHVRSGEGRMKKLTVDKGLLRETEVVQYQIKALVKCDLLTSDVENDITLTAFRLLTRDLLVLYNVENEAVMNVLSRYFEMSRPDAERAIKIYKTFCAQTELVVQYLSVARRFEHATRLEIPKLKHAPITLAASLQEYLDDPDFEINRRQYLAEQDAKKSGAPAPKKPNTAELQASSSKPASTPFDSMTTTAPSSSQSTKPPPSDLIDFFESIDQNPQGSNPFLQSQQQQLPQSTGYQTAPQNMGYAQVAPQHTQQVPPPQLSVFPSSNVGAFGAAQQQQTQPLQTQYTGAGFGGYGPQPVQSFAPSGTQQQTFASPVQIPPAQLQPQSTNPFRQSMMTTGGQFATSATQTQQSVNPFARSTIPEPIPEEPVPQLQQSQPGLSPFPPAQPQYQTQPLQAQHTGTNPFARNQSPPQQPTPQMNALTVQPTGSTNPFRQSAFVNQQTGTGWQNAPQATMGGLEQLQTIPVFPRPGQMPQQQQQQQQQASPWI
jgi:hypothetical protein